MEYRDDKEMAVLIARNSELQRLVGELLLKNELLRQQLKGRSGEMASDPHREQ
ncbi:hypothetical protein [Edaphobacter flagellatus]|uniref:hypothetical protein n=1 Tax=Edaphobacter flagellatus TaxID=1933044 RepID=UPI0021B2F2C0|nr:hypothetical protein [Edaphobacter flagellatus]